MINKNKSLCATLSCIENFVPLVFAVTGCISISTFASIAVITTPIMITTTGLNNFAIIARRIKYKSIIKKKKEA